MSFTSFNRQTLSVLSPHDRAHALLACETGEILAIYYQGIAKALIAKQNPRAVSVTPMTPGQKALAQEVFRIFSTLNAQGSSATARAALKIFLGTQMDFYRTHPQYISVFGTTNNPHRAQGFTRMLDDFEHLSTYLRPIDGFYSDALKNLKAWAQANPGIAGLYPPSGTPPRPSI